MHICLVSYQSFANVNLTKVAKLSTHPQSHRSCSMSIARMQEEYWERVFGGLTIYSIMEFSYNDTDLIILSRYRNGQTSRALTACY